MSQTAVCYFVGLDLGQVSDFTALAVLERPVVTTEDVLMRRRPLYSLRHLRRLPLGTPYPAIVQSVVSLLGAASLSGCTLAVDQTGVGRAVVDMLADALRGQVSCLLFPITITAGHAVTADDTGGLHLPKKELKASGNSGALRCHFGRFFRVSMACHWVSCVAVSPFALCFSRFEFPDALKKELVGTLQLLLQTRRLQVARTLPEAALLVKELENFRVKITVARNDTFASWREGQHDDLVLAVALAAWLGEQTLPTADDLLEETVLEQLIVV